jgi:hypothetical protein
MMRRWRYERDEEGRPRRFLSHREAFAWAMWRIGRLAALYFRPFSLLTFVGAIGRAIVRTGWPPQWEVFGFTVLLVLLLSLALCFLVACTYYLYIALAGGVMGRDERRRYHEERGGIL